MGKTFVSRILAAAVCAMAVLSSCEVHHFITDTAYRKQVEDDLRSRMEELSPLTLDIATLRLPNWKPWNSCMPTCRLRI